ncbi:MAG TPA: hypothetical protein VKZ49_13635 [Polyangiaceae bacterium]|nr:hypothetical protein [Polyangiaceae bacterium]
MRKRFFGHAAIIVPALVGGLVAAGCSEDNPLAQGAEELCGPCGVVAQGDVGISGNAKLDGFFKAVSDLNNAVVSVQGKFVTHLAQLEAAFGIEAAANASLSARVDDLVAEIQGSISANTEGGLTVNYRPAECSASASVAVQAQAQCEVKGGCDVEVDPGEISVECTGKCEGSCSGECTGEASCAIEAPSVTCEGLCEGACTLEAAAACDGTCRGTCSGTCSAYNGEGECAGQCDGECTGTCEFNAAAECTGSCSGKCLVEGGSAECTAEAECRGECSGECSGECKGTATPPSASASCEASADCKAQASAQASANIECTPPNIEVGFAFAADIDAEAQGQFQAQISALRVHGTAMVESFTRFEALINGEVDGQVVFEPAPLVQITTQLNGVVEAGASGSLFADIPAGRITCVIPAMEASVTMLGDLASETGTSLEAQASFAAAFTGGFSG